MSDEKMMERISRKEEQLLRDNFAMAAMQALLGSRGQRLGNITVEYDALGVESYRIASSMMAARASSGQASSGQAEPAPKKTNADGRCPICGSWPCRTLPLCP